MPVMGARPVPTDADSNNMCQLVVTHIFRALLRDCPDSRTDESRKGRKERPAKEDGGEGTSVATELDQGGR